MPDQRETQQSEAANSGAPNLPPGIIPFALTTTFASSNTGNLITPSRQDARYLPPHPPSNLGVTLGQFGQPDFSFFAETPQSSVLTSNESSLGIPVGQPSATSAFTSPLNPQGRGFGVFSGNENPFGFATQNGYTAASTAGQTFNPYQWGQLRSLPQDVPAKRPASPANKSTRARPTIYKSTEYEFAGPDDLENTTPRPLGRGGDSGKNKLAYFGEHEEPRLKFPILVERGRTGKDANNRYPESTEPLPRGLSLSEVCKRYPNHVWGTMLRVFLCESWNGEKIWNELPEGCRRKTAKARYWNYIQQAIGREVDLMNHEETGQKRTPQKRKRRDGEEREEENETGSGNGQNLVNQYLEGTGNPLISGITHHHTSSFSFPQSSARRHNALNDTNLEGTGNPLIPGITQYVESIHPAGTRLTALDMLKEQCQQLINGQKQNLRLYMQNEEPIFGSLPLEEQADRVQARWRTRFTKVLNRMRTHYHCEFIEANLNSPLPLMKHAFNVTRKDPEPLADGPAACREWHAKAEVGKWETYQKIMMRLSEHISRELSEQARKAVSTRILPVTQPAIQQGVSNMVQDSTWTYENDPFLSSDPPSCHNPLIFSLPMTTPAVTGGEIQMSNTDTAAMQQELPSLAMNDDFQNTFLFSSPTDILTSDPTSIPDLPFGEDPNFRFPWEEE